MVHTREICASAYSASIFPSSAECCSRSTTLIAFPLSSSALSLENEKKVSWFNIFNTRPNVIWCSLRSILKRLPVGPWPWRFGRKEDRNDDLEVLGLPPRVE